MRQVIDFVWKFLAFLFVFITTFALVIGFSYQNQCRERPDECEYVQEQFDALKELEE